MCSLKIHTHSLLVCTLHTHSFMYGQREAYKVSITEANLIQNTYKYTHTRWYKGNISDEKKSKEEEEKKNEEK